MMLNFKQFMVNAGAALSDGKGIDHYSQAMHLPDTNYELPTTSMKEPATIYRIKKTGRVYEIYADHNILWNCPVGHFEQLSIQGKAPHVGDKVKLTFYHDGSVKSFEIVNS